MVVSLIQKKEVFASPSIKEIKERVKNQKYKTYSLKHNLTKDKYPGVILNRFFWKYNETLNKIIQDIYNSITWEEWEIKRKDDKNYKQKRLYPRYRKDGDFKTELRHKYAEDWEYSAHWINSAVDTAFSILDSWKKNYDKGKRKRNCPVAKRLFVRVKQTLMKIEKVKYKEGERDRLRISIKPRMFVYINLSKRYFKIDGRIGEPILTPEHIHLPIQQEDNNNIKTKDNNNDLRATSSRELCEANKDINKPRKVVQKVAKNIGWDLNKFSMDGFSPELGWIRIDLKELYTKRVSYDNKRRRINKIGSKKKVVGKRLKAKYSKREKNVCSQIVHNITNTAKKLGIKHTFEDLNKYGMYKKGRKKWNRWISHISWKSITDQMEYKSDVELVDPYHTSKDCSRCGCTNKDLKGEKFECINKDCGLVINRQFNAPINIYLGMEGLSQDTESRQKWFDENVLKEFTQTGAECVTGELVDTARKDVNELVRHLYDLMKPQFYEVKSSKNA
jgi:putative transposase